MNTMASQITSLTIVYSTVYPGAYQRKHQSSATLAFVRGIRRSPMNSPHKGPVMRKMFPFNDVIMVNQVTREVNACWDIYNVMVCDKVRSYNTLINWNLIHDTRYIFPIDAIHTITTTIQTTKTYSKTSFCHFVFKINMIIIHDSPVWSANRKKILQNKMAACLLRGVGTRTFDT